MPDAILSLSAIALSNAIHRRQVSCREVMTATLERIARFNGDHIAIVSLLADDVLLAEADERDNELKSGRSRGWMHGFPQAPKDLANAVGIPTTSGSPIFRDFMPTSDSTIVERLRAAGAILIGKTNTPEFGLGSHSYNTVFGTTKNAWDKTLSAGGSSGGAAVALALEMLPVADGSDMMGSLRNPAGWNNVFGFRPSFGRVPGGPSPEVFLQQLATNGPMGRTVADVAMLLSTLAGYDAREPLTLREDPRVFAAPLGRDHNGVRIGWLGDFGGYLAMERGVLLTCEAALSHFGDIGCSVEDAAIDFPMARLWDAWTTLRGAIVAAGLSGLYAKEGARALLKPEAIWEVEQGLRLSAAQVWAASTARTHWYHAVMAALERWDFLVLPTAQVWPFDASLTWPREIAGRTMDTYHRWMEVVVPATMAGLPALGAPAGFDKNGLPAGVQIIGKTDLAVLQLGHAYDVASGFARARPPAICP
jgi:amidase